MADLKFKVSVDSKTGELSLTRLDKGVTKVEKSTKKAGGGFKSLAAGMAAGIAAFYAASKALRGLVRWMGDAVEKAAVQELAEKEVAAALESTGREVSANTEHFKKYAAELQGATVFGDEQILSAQALMIQLTKLDRKGLDAATKGAIGLASVYKTDLQAATTLVGKALAGNYGALSRYGIMVERTANDEQKRASILMQLQTMYKRAKAETDTYQGAVKQLSNVYGDLKEQVGDAVVQNEDFRDTIKQITELTSDLIESGLVEWVTDIATQAVKSAPMMRSLAESLGLVLLIYKMQAEEQKKASEATQEWIKHLQLNDDLQKKLRGDIAGVIIVTEDQTGAIKESIVQIDTQLEAIKGIRVGMTAWGPEIVTTTELIGGLKDSFYELGETGIPAIRDVSDVLALAVPEFEASGEAWNETLKGMTEAQLEFSSVALGELVNMEAGFRGFVDAIINTFEKWAIGQIVPKVMAALPFPFNLLATAGAIAAVKAIFTGIRSMETGGMVEKEGIYHLHAGEEVRPASEVKNIYSKSISSSRSQTVNYNITYAPRISAMDSQDVSRFMAGPGRVALISMLRDNRRGFTREIKRETDKY